MYSYKADKDGDLTFEFETADDVFFPTHTSQLLIRAARQSIREPGKLLDLGCGIGLCGLVLAKFGLCNPPVYLSDLSERGAEVATLNSLKFGVPAVVKHGSLFTPWIGERFDIIVDDVSGVCEDVAKLSPWFPEGVQCRSGYDGTALVVGVLEHAPRHLNPGGSLLFPVLSLSKEDRILEAADTFFTDVSLVAEQSWFLPEELCKNLSKLQPLIDAGVIKLEQKFGTWLWFTKVYRALSPRRTESSP